MQRNVQYESDEESDEPRFRTPRQSDDPSSPHRRRTRGQYRRVDKRTRIKSQIAPTHFVSESRLDSQRSRNKKKKRSGGNQGQRSRTRSIDINIRIPPARCPPQPPEITPEPQPQQVRVAHAPCHSQWEAGYHPSSPPSSSSQGGREVCSNSESGDQATARRTHRHQYLPVEHCAPETSGAESFSSKFAKQCLADREEWENLVTAPRFSEVEVRVSRLRDDEPYQQRNMETSRAGENPAGVVSTHQSGSSHLQAPSNAGQNPGRRVSLEFELHEADERSPLPPPPRHSDSHPRSPVTRHPPEDTPTHHRIPDTAQGQPTWHDRMDLGRPGQYEETTDDGFPFQETASGSLKINRNQVTLQSKNVAVLLANPDLSTVRNIRESHKPAVPVPIRGIIRPPTEFDDLDPPGPAPTPAPSPHHGPTLVENVEIRPVQLAGSRMRVEDRGYETEPAFPSDHYGGRESKGSKTLMENMHYRIKKAINPDTMVVIGNAEFPVHGLALQCYSKLVDKQRRTKNQIMEVHIPEEVMSSRDFPSLMDWILMEDSQKRGVIDRENVVGLFSGATFLGISQLRDDAYNFILNHVEDGDPSILNMYEEARDRHCPELVSLLASKLAGLFPKIYKSRQFLKMSPKELMLVLGADNIVIKSELDVYDAAARWLLYDWERRKPWTLDMMKTVRFGLLTPLQLTQIRHSAEAAALPNYQEIFAFPEVKKLVEDGQTYAILKGSYQGHPGELQRWMKATGVDPPRERRNIRAMPDPSQPLDHAHHQFGIPFQSEMKRKEEQRKESKKSKSMSMSQEVLEHVPKKLSEGNGLPNSPPPTSRRQSSETKEARRHSQQEIATEEDELALFNSDILRRQKEEEAATLLQTAYRGMIARRKYRKLKEAARVAQAVFRASHMKIPIKPVGPRPKSGEAFIVIGGYDSNRPHDPSNSSTSIFQLDSINNIWKLRGHLPEPRARHGSVQIDNYIYIFGGEDRSRQTSRGRNMPTGTTWSLNLVNTEWRELADMLTPRSYFGYALSQGKIFVFGGVDQDGLALSSGEVYHPRENVWEPLPPMDGPRVSPAVAKSGDKIWIVGGYTKIPSNPMLSSTIQFDVNEKRFYKGPDLPFPRCNGTLIAYYQRLILIGGATFGEKGGIRSLSDVSQLVKEEWVTVGTLKTGPRHGHCAIRVGKYVLLIGGVNSETMAAMDEVESYNVEKFRGAVKVANLPLKLSGPSGVVVR